MKARDLLRLVWSNLNRMRTRAVMSALGVLIGTAAIVILVSLAAGLQQSASQSLATIGPLNEITLLGGETLQAFGGAPQTGEDARLTPKVLKEIAALPGVVAVTPREGLAGAGPLQLNRLATRASVVGVDGRALRRLGWAAETGSLLLGRWQVLVGARVGERFSDPRRPGQTVAPVDLQGQTLKLVLSRATAEGGAVERTVRLRVAGVLAERGGQDDYSVFLALENVDELNAWVTGQRPSHDRDGFVQATVVVEDSRQVLALQQQLLTRGFLAFSASGTLQQLNLFFAVIQAIMAGVGGIALLVAGIGIANTLTMAILERTREIGLMKAVGATNRDVMGVFLAEAGAIGALGGVGGLAAGWAVTKIINLVAGVYIGAQAAAGAGAGASAPAIPDVTYIPLWLPIAVVVFATGMGVISGVYPAQRAVSLNPVAALKYE
jgi:putative ABC transport system permease protein